MSRTPVAAAALALALTAACAGSSGGTVASAPTATPTVAPSSPPAIVAPTHSPKPVPSYAPGPRGDIARAVAQGAASHRRVLIDFGASWCADCYVLDQLYEDGSVASVLSSKYVLVHVDVGHFDKNMDVSHTYHDAAKIGIPALVVLDTKGRIVTDTSSGAFANARTMKPAEVRAFLLKWA